MIVTLYFNLLVVGYVSCDGDCPVNAPLLYVYCGVQGQP